MLSEDENLNILYQYEKMDELSKDQIKQVIIWTSDKSSLIRQVAAECLFQEYPVTTKVLLRLARDRDEMVRVSAYETLRFYTSETVERFLEKAMRKERKELALAYAIASWGEVVIEREEHLDEKLKYIRRFERKRKIRKSDRCILECETVKCLLGENKAFEKIAKYIYHSDLSLRCCAIENMEYVRDEENEDKVILYMTKALNDPARRVALRARKYLKKIKAENN